jgi:putative Holliday junction resolvase
MPDTRGLVAMGFDFGLRRIGIAVGQTITGNAQALSVIPAKGGIPTDWHLIDKLMKEWLPDIFVVGLPLNMDDTEQTIIQHVKIFARQLEARYQKPVELFDERLSTVEARQRVFDHGGYKALKAKKRLDSVAAQIILESWFSERGRQ